MISYQIYSFIHILSLMVTVGALAGIAFHVMQGGTKANLTNRKSLAIIHGVGLMLALVAGFGMIARTGYSFSTSYWLYVKLVCWLLLGAFPALAYKNILPKWSAFVILMTVVGLAVWAVTFKPF